MCSQEGKGAGLVLPFCNSAAMQLHLEEIAQVVDPGAHAAILLDQVGWHIRESSPSPSALLPLPPRSPELNPVQNIRQFMRDNWLSNHVVSSHDDIVDL